MAAYGALVSVMHIMDQLHRHPRPPISLHQNQSESLTANLTFMQEFLEGYNPNRNYSSEPDPLETRIAEAAYAAEDAIESYIVDQIHAQSTDHAEEITPVDFYQDLQKVIEEMDLIKLEVKEKMKEKKNMGVPIIKKSTADADLSISSSSPAAQKATTMVGFNEALNEMLDKIAGGGVDRQILPIVGMGGLGKTTLARNIVAHPLIKERFHISAWSTISQVHNASKILNEILNQVGLSSGGDSSEGDLGKTLYQYLIGRRYLIVLDDIWSIEAWDSVRHYFPNNTHGSRIVITTRLSSLASKFNYSNGLDMKFLDEASSWELFCKTVFKDGSCPLELEGIGKKIVAGCRGLPLSIVVAGGLLSKSEPTQENWEVIEKKLSSVVNLEGDGSCLQILYASYNNLPISLKPCFLYMGVFGEDEVIEVSKLILLMVAEGCIKAFDGKRLEEAVEGCIQELVDRNLVLVEKHDDCGGVGSLKMHDLLRDLALREGGKNKFLHVLREHRCEHLEISQRRIATSFIECDIPALASPLLRSLIGNFADTFSISNFRVLRVCMATNSIREYGENAIRLFNLRVIMLYLEERPSPRILSWAPSLWNLQILYLYGVGEDCVLDIWNLHLLRHASFGRQRLPDPPPLAGDDDNDGVVLQNLHTLVGVRNLILSESVVKRISNINTLALDYGESGNGFYLDNLCRLHKLQNLEISISSLSVHPRTLAFPCSLKKLTLDKTKLPWEEMASKVGCLPLLQALKLKEDSCTGSEWETAEGQFSSLKFLLIEGCDLERWITDDAHFPRLERLVLHCLTELREIPSSIGDISTLRSMRLEDCSASAEESARRIEEEQEEYDNNLLQIQVNVEVKGIS